MIRRFFHSESIIVALLGIERFQWYRKWIGGHWELWYIDVPVSSAIWIQVPECSALTGCRPSGLARGTPICENHIAK